MEPGPPVFIDQKKFTHGEFLVIQQAMKDKSHKEIAKALHIPSYRTVDTHFRSIYKTLGIHKVTELIAWGCKVGFDDLGNYRPKAMEIPLLDPPVRVTRKKRKKAKSSSKKLPR